MRNELCQREDELLDALGRGFLGRELEDHIVGCAPCAELHMVAGALLDDRSHSIVEAPIPTSGGMWWRMRLRQRHDAEGKARRSLLFGQAATLSVAIALMIFFFGADLMVTAREVVSTVRFSTPLLLAILTTILLAPIAGWVAIRGK